MPMKALTREDSALPMHYPGFVYRALCEEGVPSADLLAGTELTAELLHDPNHRFSFLSLRRLTLNALDLTGEPHLGIRLGKRFEATYIGLPAYAAMNAASFIDALNVLSRFFVLTFPTIDFHVLKDASDHGTGGGQDEAEIQLRPNLPYDEIRYFISGFALSACDGLFHSILRRPKVTLRGQMMADKPADWDTVSAQFAFPVSFGGDEVRLFVPAELLDLPLPGTDPVNHSRLLALCEQAAAQAAVATTLEASVVAFLQEDENIGASLSETAAALGFSERGLRRQLEHSGTSFRTLVDQVRYGRARNMLINTAKPISTVAYELGYDSPSNFARSFKRWTGKTPKAYREDKGA